MWRSRLADSFCTARSRFSSGEVASVFLVSAEAIARGSATCEIRVMKDFGRRKFLSGASAVGAAIAAGSSLVDDDAEAQLRAPQIVSEWGPTPKVLTVWRFKVQLPRILEVQPTVTWSGSGTFQSMGPTQCLATFQAPGPNTIRAAFPKSLGLPPISLSVVAKDADLYARLGSQAAGAHDDHGCPACPHPVQGMFVQGMADLTIRGRPAVHVGHKGVHKACCGPNTFELETGDPEVLVNGKALGIVGSRTKHCGGEGRIIVL